MPGPAPDKNRIKKAIKEGALLRRDLNCCAGRYLFKKMSEWLLSHSDIYIF